MKIDARTYAGIGLPHESGAKLADGLLAAGVDWNDLEVDVRDLPPRLATSDFFLSFLQRIHDKRPELLDAARHIKWDMNNPAHQLLVPRWMREFQPQTPTGPTAR